MNKLSKEKRDRLILVLVGTGALLLTLYLLVISAQKDALDDCTSKIDTAKEKLAKAERWARMAPSIQARLQSCRQELEAKHEGMAPLDKFKWFYNTLDKFLAQRPVHLTDITREPEIGEVGLLPKFPYQAATFGVKLTGRYQDFGRFLADFENHFPYMRVQNLEVDLETGLKPASKEGTSPAAELAVQDPEALGITMRVVTLIKPSTPF